MAIAVIFRRNLTRTDSKVNLPCCRRAF